MKLMNSINQFKREFLRIYEQIAQRRGLSPILGRIMGVFFLEENELNQKELSEKTDYSISSISRALEQMIRLGIVTKHKHTSREYFVYDMSESFFDLALRGIKRWTEQAEQNRKQINALLRKVEDSTFSPEENGESQQLKAILKSLTEDIKLFINAMGKAIQQLESLK